MLELGSLGGNLDSPLCTGGLWRWSWLPGFVFSAFVLKSTELCCLVSNLCFYYASMQGSVMKSVPRRQAVYEKCSGGFTRTAEYVQDSRMSKGAGVYFGEFGVL